MFFFCYKLYGVSKFTNKIQVYFISRAIANKSYNSTVRFTLYNFQGENLNAALSIDSDEKLDFFYGRSTVSKLFGFDTEWYWSPWQVSRKVCEMLYILTSHYYYARGSEDLYWSLMK